jgi:hypothetical protein
MRGAEDGRESLLERSVMKEAAIELEPRAVLAM